jgi:anti-sigma-K factor RskA
LNLNIDTEVLRSYLLGTLEAEPRAELEERILCDPAIYDELLLLEEELIDQYVADGLSKAERQQFETHFLITAERQQKLRFGQLLKRHLSPQTIPAISENVPVPQLDQTVPSRRFFSVLAFAVVIVTVLGIALLCWFAFRKPEVVVQLAPGSVEKQGVTVPPQGFNVKIELAVANTSFKNYKSELFRENTRVQTNALKIEKKGEQQIVPLTITGETLSPGDYQVKLSGVSESGQDEFIDNYTFRVTTK